MAPTWPRAKGSIAKNAPATTGEQIAHSLYFQANRTPSPLSFEKARNLEMSLNNFVVLYVDDEPSNLFAFRAAFRKHVTVLTAASMKEGLIVLDDQPVDLLITDQIMPEGTGLELLQRTLTEFPDLQRALITAYGHLELVKQALNDGKIHWYLEKPWNEQELLGVIRSAYTEITDRDYRREQINALTLQMFQSKQRVKGLLEHLEQMNDMEGASIARSILRLLEQG